MAKETVFGTERFFFYFPKNLIRFIGFWPENEVIFSWQIAFAIFNALEILAYGIFQVNFCLENKNDLVMLLNGFTPLVTQVITSIKILIIVAKRREIKKLLDHLHNSFTNGKFIMFDVNEKTFFLFLIRRHSKWIQKDQRESLQTFFHLFNGASGVCSSYRLVLHDSADRDWNLSLGQWLEANVRVTIQISVRSLILCEKFKLSSLFSQISIRHHSRA